MKNSINELLSKLVREGTEIVAHISYWSGEFQTQTFEDSIKQKKQLKEYPVIIYNWNEKAKGLIKEHGGDINISDFLKGDEKLMALELVNIEIDDGYRSREALSDDSIYDPATEQYSAESYLSIIKKIINNKIEALKACLDAKTDIGKDDDGIIIKFDKRFGTHFKFHDVSFDFDGRTGLILFYLYETKRANNEQSYKTYNDFVEAEYFDEKEKLKMFVSSGLFRQSIDDINERVKKETAGVIESLIKKISKGSKANNYRWSPEVNFE